MCESYLGYLHHANEYWSETLSFGSVVHKCCKDENLVDLWEVTDAGAGPASRLNGTARWVVAAHTV